jgi:hypothetical protein
MLHKRFAGSVLLLDKVYQPSCQSAGQIIVLAKLSISQRRLQTKLFWLTSVCSRHNRSHSGHWEADILPSPVILYRPLFRRLPLRLLERGYHSQLLHQTESVPDHPSLDNLPA